MDISAKISKKESVRSLAVTINHSVLVRLPYYASRLVPRSLDKSHKYYQEVTSLHYKVRKVEIALSSAGDIYKEILKELHLKAYEDRFTQEVYYDNNMISQSNMSLRRSVNNVINDTAELYEALRFILAFTQGGSASRNLKSYLSKNPQYNGRVRSSLIVKEWNNRKHDALDLSVSVPRLTIKKMEFVESRVSGCKYIPTNIRINEFYNFILDDTISTLKEFTT